MGSLLHISFIFSNPAAGDVVVQGRHYGFFYGYIYYMYIITLDGLAGLYASLDRKSVR